MSASIDTLKSQITSGLARSNQFRVLFHTEADRFSVLCDSVTWPGRQIFTNERLVDMKTQKVAYAFGQEDVAMSFLLTNDWETWDFIYDWHNRVIGNIEGTREYTVNFKNTYTEDIEIEHLDNAGSIKKKVKLKNAFPTTLSALELGNGNENEVIRVSTEFSYDNWEIIS
jgi:hypothetical protein